MHELSQYVSELPTVEDWLSGDDRALVFEVVDSTGDPVDISGASVAWALYEREYNDDPTNAVLTGDDSGVELVTDSRVDITAGEWEVRIDGAATSDEWGQYWHRPSVEQSDGSTATWRGEVIIEA
jgi:hypothetical protein